MKGKFIWGIAGAKKEIKTSQSFTVHNVYDKKLWFRFLKNRNLRQGFKRKYLIWLIIWEIPVRK